MIEILNPRWGDVRPVFEREFRGMVVEPVTAEELKIVAEQLVSRLHEEMPEDENLLRKENPGGICWVCQGSRISLLFGGNFKTYGE